MFKRDETPKGVDTYDITIEDVIVSNLIPELDPMHLKFIGKNWFKDDATGIAYHFIKDAILGLQIKETRQSIADKRIKARVKPTPPPTNKFTTITCIDCGAPREINIQYAFQVKRCITCQKKYRNAKRLARIKEKRKEEKEMKE